MHWRSPPRLRPRHRAAGPRHRGPVDRRHPDARLRPGRGQVGATAREGLGPPHRLRPLPLRRSVERRRQRRIRPQRLQHPRRHPASRPRRPRRATRHLYAQSGVCTTCTPASRRRSSAAPARQPVQIDHLVSLSDAWYKGAREGDPQRRRDFANDPRNLLAVGAQVNFDKAFRDATAWLPPNGLPLRVRRPPDRGQDDLPAVGVEEREAGDGRRAGRLLAQRDQPESRCQRVGHPHVVRFGGQLVDEFVVADHRDQPRRRIGQRQRAGRRNPRRGPAAHRCDRPPAPGRAPPPRRPPRRPAARAAAVRASRTAPSTRPPGRYSPHCSGTGTPARRCARPAAAPARPARSSESSRSIDPGSEPTGT